jgi:hypothetical protein
MVNIVKYVQNSATLTDDLWSYSAAIPHQSSCISSNAHLEIPRASYPLHWALTQMHGQFEVYSKQAQLIVIVKIPCNQCLKEINK